MLSFVANLKPYTFHPGRGVRRFDGYLLSPDHATSSALKLARTTRDEGRHLCADNGNVDQIRLLASSFAEEAKTLRARFASEIRTAKADPTHRPSKRLQGAFGDIADRIRARSASITSHAYTRNAVAGQSRIDGTYAIGMEDLTITALSSLSLEPTWLGKRSSFFRALNRRALTFALETTEGKYGPLRARCFAGLHAMNYDQAFDVGREAARSGVDAIAMGFGGALRDRKSTYHRVERGRVVELEASVARPYLRVAELVVGLHEGYRSETGRCPDFHALGIGSPILIPLLGLVSGPGFFTAADSTAPIVDGWSGPTIGLYVDDPAPMKLKAYKVADAWVRGGRGWDCACSHCRRFEAQYPARLDAARRWWRQSGRPKVRKSDLDRSGPLAALLPLLGRHPDLEIRTASGLARTGHNHAILMRLQRRTRNAIAAGDIGMVEGMVRDYSVHAGSPRWGRAAVEALRLFRRFARASRPS